MRTVCLLSKRSDASWLREYRRAKGRDEELVIAATSFEARVFADSQGVEYEPFEEEALSIGREELFDFARSAAYTWCEQGSLGGDPRIEALRSFRGFPLLAMHQSRLLLKIYALLQAWMYVRRIIDRVRPDRIVVGDHDDPFSLDLPQFMGTNNGLERAAARLLAGERRIEFLGLTPEREGRTLRECVRKGVRRMRGAAGRFRPLPGVRRRQGGRETLLGFPPSGGTEGAKVLLFVWGDYYFAQVRRTIEALLEEGARILVVVNGGALSWQQESDLRTRGVHVTARREWVAPEEERLRAEWEARGRAAAGSLAGSEVLKSFFAREGETFYPAYVEKALSSELSAAVPRTVVELMRTEALLDHTGPDLVFAHFSMHPLESCDVLPARARGIPTLTMNHGVTDCRNSERYTHAAEYYAVEGEMIKEAVVRALEWPEEDLFVVGDPRLEEPSGRPDAAAGKRDLGFDSARPLLVFCDGGDYSHSTEKRHSTYRTVQEILGLRKRVPGLQILYRVHHGPDYAAMRDFFLGPGLEDVVFQESLDSPLAEALAAADLLVAHHSSALTEALARGVRAVYLCALSDVAPGYLGYEAIVVVREFAGLSGAVSSILDDPRSPEEVRAMAQPYFDRKLCGLDGRAHLRLARLVLKLAKREGGAAGFESWLDRIEASCRFTSSTWSVRC